MMMEKDEHERKQRIERKALESLQNSKLFPRMQALVDLEKQKEKERLFSGEAEHVNSSKF